MIDIGLPRDDRFFARVPGVTRYKIEALAGRMGDRLKALSPADVVIELVDRAFRDLATEAESCQCSGCGRFIRRTDDGRSYCRACMGFVEGGKVVRA